MLVYLLVRILTYPLALLPYPALHALGSFLGRLTYQLHTRFRKRALANIALSLPLSNKEIKEMAKKSFESLMITCLEYPKLSREKKISNIVTCENPEVADELIKQGKGVLFFVGHQANWELLFLEGTSRMKGVAIGRPIKNQYLYRWILSIRQKYGGRIVPPKEGIKEGLRALKEGGFFGIVGDQGMPGSGYSSPFLGRTAWTSPIPALLSYKTGRPIIVATTKREKGRYTIRYSAPLFPNCDAPKESEVKRLMDETLSLYEASIYERPHEWLWIHNRWKQQSLDAIKKSYRFDGIGVLLPQDTTPFDLTVLRAIYPTETITLLCPKDYTPPIAAEIIPYTHTSELFREDFRFPLLFNLTGDPKLTAHYKKFATQKAVSLDSLDPSLIQEICHAR